MKRCTAVLLVLVGACGGGGGGGGGTPLQQEPLALWVQALDKAVAGQSVPLLVSVRRGNTLVRDYVGAVTFESPDPTAWYPSFYRFTEGDGGERVFTTGFVFPQGVHMLTVTGEGIEGDVRIGISVSAGSTPPPPVFGPGSAPPPVPGEPKYFSSRDFYTFAIWLNDLAFGDADGDGDLDVAVAGGGGTYSGSNPGNIFQVWKNDGAGSLSVLTDIAAQSTYRVAFVDADGDGDQDLAAILLGGVSNQARLWWNDGSGAFSDSGQDLGNGLEFIFDDLDGDGDPDLVLAGTTGFVVRANDGNGGFGSLVQSKATSSGLHTLALGDLDGDGDLDLVAAKQIWLNDGAGTFAATGQGVGNDAKAVESADMDGDGDLDLVIGNYDQANDLYLNDGQAAFTRSDAWQSTKACTTDLALVDLDEDGDLDILEALQTNPGFAWINEGGTFTKMNLGWGIRLAAGDLDSDGDADFAVVHAVYLFTFRND